MTQSFFFALIIYLIVSTQVFASQITGNTTNVNSAEYDTVQVDKVRLQQLETQLIKGISIGKTVHELLNMLDESQLAMQPLIKFFKSKYFRKRDEERALRTIFKRMKKFFAQNPANQASINNLIDTIGFQVEHRAGWTDKLPEVMVVISNNTILSATQVDQLGKIARRDQELRNYTLSTTNAAIPLLKAIALQGMHHALNRDIRDLAIKCLKSSNNVAIKVGLAVLESQSRFNDSDIITALDTLTSHPPNRRIANIVIKDKIQDLEIKPDADNEILALIKNYQNNEQYSSVSPNYFKRLQKNPYIKPGTRAKLYMITTKNSQAGEDYLKLLEIEQQIGKSRPGDEHVDFILKCFTNYIGYDLNRQAMALLIEIKENYGLSVDNHHKLIEYFIRLPEMYRVDDFGQFTNNSIPFAYSKIGTKENYDDKLIETVISSLTNVDNIRNVYRLKILNGISKHQTFSRNNIDKLYSLMIDYANNMGYIKIIAEIITDYYKQTGYANIEIINQSIARATHPERRLVDMVISVTKKDKQRDAKEVLLDYYLDTNLSDDIRKKAFYELVNMDFQYAQEQALPPYALDSKRMKYAVWGYFSEYSRKHNLLIDKNKLLDATNSPDTQIQQIAWELLKPHGVSIPLRKRMKHPYYGAELKFNLLTVFSLVSVVIAFFLYIGGIKKHDSTVWKFMQVLLWILATTTFIGVDIFNTLIHGLSHSGYPYRSASAFLITSNTIYLGAGVVMRVVTLFMTLSYQSRCKTGVNESGGKNIA